MHSSLQTFLLSLQEAVSQDALVLLQLGSYKGKEKGLKSARLRAVRVRDNIAYAMVLRYATRDVTKIFLSEDVPGEVAARIGHGLFRDAVLQTRVEEIALHVVTEDRWTLRRKANNREETPDTAHNREKARLVPAEQPYLRDLGIADGQGRIVPKAMDKYVQINHFLALMEASLGSLTTSTLRILDMGAGKGYLTFALYDYVTRVLGKSAQVTGVEQREDLVVAGNARARAAGFTGLTFRAGSIAEERAQAEVLVALHACDTATDEAIFHGIRVGAEVIAVAPCCHKEVRQGMAKKLPRVTECKTRFGVMREREAEMVTDALRALLLEYAGYRVRMAEFVSDQHTPKNILLTAVKRVHPPKAEERREMRETLREMMTYYGLRTQRLAALLEREGILQE